MNQRLCDMLGYSRDQLLGKPLHEFAHPEDAASDAIVALGHQGEDGSPVREMRYVHSNGSIVWAALTVNPVRGSADHPRYCIAVVEDITERKQAEEALRVSEERFRLTFDLAAIGIAHVGPQGRFLRVNQGLCAMLGYTRDELLGSRFQEVTHPEDLAHNLEYFEKLMSGEISTYAVKKRYICKGGSQIWATATTSLVCDGAGRPDYTISIIEDISDRERAQQALRHQALHDSLTGLPNRTLLHERMEQSIVSSRRSGAAFALLLLDLDGFKEINDAFGHHVGDELLRHVAMRLNGALRESDTVARLGGDEFAVLLPGTDSAGASATARKVLQGLERPFDVGGRQLNVAGSIGIAAHPDHGMTSATLLQHADVAMYDAKRRAVGGRGYSSFAHP
jgi:diguanylate cyclase (GGDEF)-like protein/PAS domain S-box-containing protein